MPPFQSTALQLGVSIATGQTSSREVVRETLDRIAKIDPRICSFLSVAEEEALLAAEAVDRRLAAGEKLGPLAGVPIAIKDNICTSQQLTTCSSRMLSDYRPPYDASVVRRLTDAGCIIVGKTNMDEFAMGSSTENSAVAITRNPWDLSRAPGGSSGGAAACVAAGLVPISLGSDTGGSIRQPASLCGVCGLKPTYGRVSRYGLIAFASSLDQIGPLAMNCEDLAAVLQIIGGHDPLDSTSIDAANEDYLTPLATLPPSLRVGVVESLLDSDAIDTETAAAVRSAMEVFRSHGATIVPIEMPHARYGIPTYYIVASSEASSNLSRYSGAHFGYRSEDLAGIEGDAATAMIVRSRSEGFGAEVKRRIMLGTYTLSAGYYDAYYNRALKTRRLIRQDYDEAFQKVDILLGPTTTGPAFALGEKTTDPVQMYLEDLFTVGANLAGIPALSLPVGRSRDDLPLAIQLQAGVLQESLLLQCGHWFERWSGYTPAWPELDPVGAA